ncbi:MAG: hypothetical protein MK180_00770 [Rhodobacteraceae bacterium]|nr:hypothetical protein [Paracoccaceae bacterium]
MLHSGVAEAAIERWSKALPGLSAAPPSPPAMLWQLSIGGQDFTLLDSPAPHEFALTPSWSFMVDLDTAEAVDAAYSVLEDGGPVLMPPDTYDFAERFA